VRQKKGGHNIYFLELTRKKYKIKQGGGHWGSPFQDIPIVLSEIFLTPAMYLFSNCCCSFL